jgi:hypothetical protein
MSEVADQARHEFWRPPLLASDPVIKLERSGACTHCGTEFIVSSIYCHSCGAKRPPLNSAQTIEVPGLAELTALGDRLGLTVPAVAAFVLGALCLIGALAVSIFFSARTALDWQAIQLWRIEWLVAAIAAFVAGCLLKK